MIPSGNSIPPVPSPPPDNAVFAQVVMAVREMKRNVEGLQRYLQTYREVRTQTTDEFGNPIVGTVLMRLVNDGTTPEVDGDYDFKVTDAGGASGTSGTVNIADGLVQDSDLSNFNSTSQDPVPSKIVYQFAVTGIPSVAVNDGDSIYLRFTMTTPSYYTYLMNVAPGSAADAGGGMAAGLYTHGDGKIFNNGTATVDAVAIAGLPGAADTGTVGHIRLCTVHITGGVMTFSNRFPRHIIAPMIIAPTRDSLTP